MPPAVLDRTFLRDIFRQIEDAGQRVIEHPKTSLLMVLVPVGKFLCNTGRSGPFGTGASAPFEVDLPAYHVAMHPVTNSQYTRFVAETRHRPPDNRVWQESGRMDHPVTNVSWDDAMAYCIWAGLRLPTELQWEKAARGLDGRAYPWGNDWDPNRCRNNTNQGGETTASVWRYGQSGAPFGALQLSGNVWEWCADWYVNNAYTSYRQGNLAPPSSGQYRVVRGGSCDDGHPDRFSASIRRFDIPFSRNDNYGFRCVGGLLPPVI